MNSSTVTSVNSPSGNLQEDHVAEDLIVVVAVAVQPVPAAFGAEHGSARLGRPTLLPHGDEVFHLDAIAASFSSSNWAWAWLLLAVMATHRMV